MSKSVVVLTEENFDAEVLAAKGTVLVDFWASWCGPCRIVSPIIDEIADETENLKVGKINVDEQPGLAARYAVMSIPTLMAFRDGKQLQTSVGVRSKTDILSMVNN